jgi:hypothetical protein
MKENPTSKNTIFFNNNPTQFPCLQKKPDLEKGVSNGMIVARVHKYFFMNFVCFKSVF